MFFRLVQHDAFPCTIQIQPLRDSKKISRGLRPRTPGTPGYGPFGPDFTPASREPARGPRILVSIVKECVIKIV